MNNKQLLEMLIECVEESSTDITINSPCGSYKWELNDIVRGDFLIKSLKARLEGV